MKKLYKISGVLTILTTLLLIGFVVLYHFLGYTPNEDNGLGLAIVVMIFVGYGTFIMYAGAAPFIICGLIFGIKMLRAQDTDKLYRLNVKMLIVTLVLALLVALAPAYVMILFAMQGVDLFSAVYTIIFIVSYFLLIVSLIGTLIVLRFAE